MVVFDSLDSSRNLQAKYGINFLFRLDLILHACKILIRCDNFGILNFTTKQGYVFVCPVADLAKTDCQFRFQRRVRNEKYNT